jgi:type VI secretion system protein ImpA
VDWEKASQAETQRGTDGQAKAPAVTFAQLQQSAALTASSSLLSTLEAVRQVLRYSAELDQLLDDRLGREAPSLAPIRAVGEAVVNVISKLLRERGSNVLDLQEKVKPSLDASTSILGLGNALLDAQSAGSNLELASSDPAAVRIATRAHAYLLLGEIAAFLTRTEPHSPAPYLIRRAIAWGAMSFDELLPELVRNQAELVEIYRLLNVRPNDSTKK